MYRSIRREVGISALGESEGRVIRVYYTIIRGYVEQLVARVAALIYTYRASRSREIEAVGLRSIR
jgi:hypothetical protein